MAFGLKQEHIAAAKSAASSAAKSASGAMTKAWGWATEKEHLPYVLGGLGVTLAVYYFWKSSSSYGTSSAPPLQSSFGRPSGGAGSSSAVTVLTPAQQQAIASQFKSQGLAPPTQDTYAQIQQIQQAQHLAQAQADANADIAQRQADAAKTQALLLKGATSTQGWYAPVAVGWWGGF